MKLESEERRNEVKEQTYNFHSNIRSVAMLLAQLFNPYPANVENKVSS
jgi:hypothetical protein